MQNVQSLTEQLDITVDYTECNNIGCKASITISEASFLTLAKKKSKISKSEMKKRVQQAWDNVSAYSNFFKMSVRSLLHPTLVAESFTLVSAM